MVAICGGVLMLCSSLFALLSTVTGTCTQGSADELEIGGLVCALGYAIGEGLLVARPPRRSTWFFLSPVLIAVGYQTYLAVSFFVAYHVHGLSACAWKESIPEFEADGREPFLTALWLGVSAFGLVGLAYAWYRGEQLRLRNADNSS